MAKKEKLRGFVFYSQDYFGDVAVRLMPGYLRIVWVEAFLLMDQSPRRGVLLKKNGTPYTAEELAKTMNVPIEHVHEAHDWVLREGIAERDRATQVLANRRMIRERKRSEINSKNGRKGGNPALNRLPWEPTKDRQLSDSLNRPVKASDKPKPDPDPDPDPELIRLIKDNSSLVVSPPAEKRGGNVDAAAERFRDRHAEITGVPYKFRKKDFVHLTDLRKLYQIGTRETPPGWNEASENYLRSPLPKYSIGDLCVRYAVFLNSALDQFNKPINHASRSNANGSRPESEAERKERRTDAAADALVHHVAEKIGGPVSGGVDGTYDGRLPRTPRELSK